MRHSWLAMAVFLAGGCLGDLVPYHAASGNVSTTDLGQAGNPNPGPSDDLAQAATGNSDLATAGSPPDLGNGCIAQTTALTDGHHNPGQNCMNCHNANNPGIGQWTVAGTLYSAVTGGAPVAGATVEIVDSQGKVLPILSSTNGNFYTDQPLVPPLRARATACPANVPMNATAATGACTSCHNSTMQVHVP